MRHFLPLLAAAAGLSLLGTMSGCASSSAHQGTAVPSTSSNHEFNPATQRYEANGPYGSRENRSNPSGASARP